MKNLLNGGDITGMDPADFQEAVISLELKLKTISKTEININAILHQ